MKRFLRLISITIIIGFGYLSGSAQIVRPVNDTTICLGESVILEAQTGSYMYNWSTGQLSPTIIVSPAVTTTYDLRVFIPDTATELIGNGDFDFGNTGFYSEYVYCSDPVLSLNNTSDSLSLYQEGRYAVDDDANAYHANFSSCNGRTGNSPDNMLIVNGSPDENVVVWSQTITVNPNQYYAFSTWAANIHPTNPARLEFMIDGVLMGDYIEPSVGLTCNWEEFYSLWYSGAKTSAEISIVNKNLIRSGNDYALDGVSFNPLDEVPDSITVVVIDSAVVEAGSDITMCGNETANLSATVSNETGFLWSTSGDGTFSNSSNINSTYTPGSNDASNGSVILTATANSNSPCGSVSDFLTLNLNPVPVVDLGIDQETCAGGSITFDAGNAGSTYLWSTGETTQTITVSTSGNYSVTITDTNGCSASDNANATIHANPTVNLGADQETCAGGSITFDAGNVGSTYLWSTGETTQTISVSASGNYSVTVTNTNGCSASDDADVIIHADPTVNLGADQETCAGGSITFDAGNVGSTYLWSTGETTQTISVSTSGNYSVTVTNTNGCSASDNANVVIHANPTVNLGADQEICAGGSITFDAGNAGSTYLWSTGETTQTISVSTSGNYSVTVTNTNGCSASDNANAVIHANPTVNLGADQETCAGGSITFDAGNVGSTYLWSTGETTQAITVSASGNYSVTITDTNGCSASDDADAVIHANPVVDLGIDQEICAGGSITFDAGNVGSTYLWSTGETTQTISVSVSGNYSVTVTNANGCSASDNADATIHANPTVNLGADQEICAGGSITFDAGNAGSTYLWSTGETTQTITVSTSGNYSVTITDTNGCSAGDDVNAVIHANPTVNLGADQESCAGGTITFDAGNAGSTYLWSTGETTQAITVSTSGNYSVTITDTNGCSAGDDVNAVIHANPVVDLGIDQETCAGGSITFDAGNVGSTYLWSTGETTQTISVSVSDSYSVTVTNTNGCSAGDDADAVIHANPVVDLGTDQALCEGNVVLDAGNQIGSYLWNTGETTQTITVSASGNYFVGFTDTNACVATDSVAVRFYPAFDFNLSYSTNLVCYGDSTYIEGPIHAGYSYQWNKDGSQLIGETNYSIKAGDTGWYTLNVFNENGCFASDSVRVEIIHLPNNSLPSQIDMCFGESVLLDIGDGESFLWSDGVITQTRLAYTSGVYSVEVRDFNGCIGSDSVNVVVHDLPIVDLGPDLFICKGEELIIEAPDGYQSEWIPGGQTKEIYVYDEGEFTLKATDEFGCVGHDEIQIFVHDNPNVYLGRDTVIGEGTAILLDAGSGYVEYKWSNQESSQFLKVTRDGEYAVSVIDMNGCRGNGKVKVAVNPLPDIHLGGTAGICEGTSLMLDPGHWERYKWSTGETTRTINVNQTGDYIVSVWDVYGIMGIDTLHVEVYPSPKLNLAADTLSFYKGQTVTIDAGSGYSSYYWSTGSDWRSIEVEEPGDYSVQVMNAFGCVAQSAAAVKLLQPKMVVPNVFTPNGKGPNEIFYPVFKGVVTDFELYIYSRWGEQVFELRRDVVSNNELKYDGWNGTYKGEESEIGVYVWIIFYGGKERAHGTVTLFR